MFAIYGCCYVFLYVTLSLKRQSCSRRLWTCLNKKYGKSLYISKYYDRIGSKTLWPNGALLILNNNTFCHNVLKSCVLQMYQKDSVNEKVLIMDDRYMCVHVLERIHINIQIQTVKPHSLLAILCSLLCYRSYMSGICINSSEMNCITHRQSII